MDIYSQKGSKVIFINKNGYDHEPSDAVKLGLVEGKEYTVDSVDVGRYMSHVKLQEFPEKYFNTVMFENVKTV